jgi:hypothetical protein
MYSHPVYVAVMDCVPTGNAAVLNVAVACPAPEAVSVLFPSKVPPFLKATFPTGVTPLAEETAAVNVAVWPQVKALDDALRTVEVVVGFTTCEMAFETLVVS